jgi:hypothetical protein
LEISFLGDLSMASELLPGDIFFVPERLEPETSGWPVGYVEDEMFSDLNLIQT